MPRLMSVALTEPQVRDQSKTVTRRLGRKFLKQGDIVTLVRKSMGLRKGEKVVRICDVEVVRVRREPVWCITDEDIVREAVPWDRFDELWADTNQATHGAWVRWFCRQMKCTPCTEVTRIEWRYL